VKQINVFLIFSENVTTVQKNMQIATTNVLYMLVSYN